MAKLAMGWGEAQEAIELYAQRDEFGRGVWTLDRLAEKYGVGETTMFRVVNRKGPYKMLKRPKTEEELQAETEEIFANLAKATAVVQRDQRAGEEVLEAMQAKGKAQLEDPGLAERVATAVKPPLSPLDE